MTPSIMEKQSSKMGMEYSQWSIELAERKERSKPNQNQNHHYFALRLSISALVLIWLFFSAVPHFFKLSSLTHPDVPQRAINDPSGVSFEDIVPSEDLEWHKCYFTFYCARLTVPMDYNRPLTDSKYNPKVHIALVLAPGAHNGAKKFSTSPLLLNPGGPGGSGTTFALLAAGMLQKMIDPEQDIIGFDPRGVGATTPRADCFAYPSQGTNPGGDYSDEDYVTGSYNRMMWENAGLEVGAVNSSSNSLLQLDVRARTIARLCQEKDDAHGKNSILKYVHTPSVARDMISIIDAWDKWRDAMNQESSPCHDSKTTASAEPEDAISNSTKGKLVYWGFSYGTLLGATFASMFPDRVGRVVLDGVVDADKYVTPVWTESIQDADAVFDSFSKYCFEATQKCDLYRESDKSATDIADRFESVMMDVKSNPISLTNHGSPLIITHSLLRRIVFAVMYAPNAGFPLIATIADWLYRGNKKGLESPMPPRLPPLCGPQPPPAYTFPNEAQVAIMCSDKRYPLNETVPELQLRFEQMANDSSWADIWLTVMLGCEGWTIEASDPPMRWDENPIDAQKPINTSFPLLFISNSFDPVTPLASGLKMAKLFSKAGLIEQKSEGHCSIAAVSICTLLKLRAYFRAGVVPAPPTDNEWEKCAANEWPWHPLDQNVYAELNEKLDVDFHTVEAAQQVQRVFSNMNFFGANSLLLKSLK